MSESERLASDPFLTAAQLEGMPSAFAATRDGIDALLRDRGLRRTTPEDTARSLLDGAAASARLEGSQVDADDLAAGAGDPTARGLLRLSGELLSLVPVWTRAPIQAIARMHALATGDLGESGAPGRPVNEAGVHRLTKLARALARPTAAPGLVVAAIVHAEIVAAGAFVSHNGAVARAAERLVLVVTGVDPASVLVPEAGHAAAPQGYRAALESYRTDGETGVHRWLDHASHAFAHAAEVSSVSR